MGTALFADGTDGTPIDAVTCGPIHSSSKAHLEVPGESGDGQRVPVRRIALTDGTTFDVYDTSGPYTAYASAADCHDLASGLPPTRREWSHPGAVPASPAVADYATRRGVAVDSKARVAAAAGTDRAARWMSPRRLRRVRRPWEPRRPRPRRQSPGRLGALPLRRPPAPRRCPPRPIRRPSPRRRPR